MKRSTTRSLYLVAMVLALTALFCWAGRLTPGTASSVVCAAADPHSSGPAGTSGRAQGAISVGIRIQPDKTLGSLDLGSQDDLPVAILSSPDFKAADVDPMTIKFAGAPTMKKAGAAGSQPGQVSIPAITIAGTATWTGVLTLTSGGVLSFCPPVTPVQTPCPAVSTGPPGWNVPGSGTGDLATYGSDPNGGTITTLSSVTNPVGVTLATPTLFMSFAPAPGVGDISFYMQTVFAGVGDGCGSVPAAGQTCTPAGSAVTFLNVVGGNSSATISMQGFARHASDAPGFATATPLQYIFTFQFNKPFQSVLADFAAGPLTSTYSATATANPVAPPPTCSITCPADVTQPNNLNQCGGVVTYPAPTPTGTCGTITCSPASGSFFPVGATTVTCTSGAANCSFTVTVQDTQAPTITCPPNGTAITDQTVCPSPACQVVNFPAPVATDNCPGVVVVCNPAAGSCLPVGATTVTCTATDASGNMATCSFTISTFDVALQDDSDPSIILLWNSMTGAYRFCCNGITFTGVGKVTNRGCTFSLEVEAIDRRIVAIVDKAAHAGHGSLQALSGNTRCTITDRNTLNDTNLTSCQ